jgi:hypothetical protein
MFIAAAIFTSCKKEKDSLQEDGYVYYEVGFKSTASDWRDTAFVVRTNKQQLIQEADAQLALPVMERKIVFGDLAAGDGGHNKNASHVFNWHFKEDAWRFVDVTVEIYDGRPYTDVHLNTHYWLNAMTRFGAWGSYIKKKLEGKP